MCSKIYSMCNAQSLFLRYTIFVHDVQVLRDIFTKNADLAGRPYVERHWFTQSLGNPFFPDQGNIINTSVPT